MSSEPINPPPERAPPLQRADGEPSDELTPSAVRGRTLPPPWGGLAGPLSVTALTLAQQRPGAAVSRRKGPRAELATFEAQLRTARAAGDAEAERRAASGLSRALAARGAEMDTATKLARRALVLGEDAGLRTELSTWLAGLGEPALAAETLRPVLSQRTGPALGRLLTRIAVLLARAGDGAGAGAALQQATEHAPAEPLAPELLGAVGTWAPDSSAPESTALAYVEGSRRRARSGEKAAAFEDLLRAFEAAPQCAVAAEALHQALYDRGRSGAADEVLREHARALLDDEARQVHLKRLALAVEEGEYHRAVAAGLDAHLEADFDLALATEIALGSAPAAGSPMGFERLLEEVGLHELLAVRLDVAADGKQGAERARARIAAARIYAGKLGRPTRAVQGWLDALVHDPGASEAREGLRAHAAQTMDFSPLVEALIRVARKPVDSAAWRSNVEELLRLGEERLADPGLAAWAARCLAQQEPAHARAREALERLAPRIRLQNEALRAARDSAEHDSGTPQALVRLANVLLGRPERAEEALPILEELALRMPGQGRWRQHYRLVLERLGHTERLDRLLEQLAADAYAPEREAFVVERARLARARGDFARALELLGPSLTRANTQSELSALGLVLATRTENQRARAQALVQVAAPLSPPLRATLLSLAVEDLLASGEIDEAIALSEQACHADPSRTRPVAARALAVASAANPDQVALERAVGVVVPRTSICAALAEAYETEGSALLALAWTQRQLALRPGDLAIAEVLLGRVIRAAEPARLSDALAWLLSQPEPLERLVVPIGQALMALRKLEPQRSAALARRTLDVLGPRDDELRNIILEVAQSVGERGLAIAVLERWLAAGAPDESRGPSLVQIVWRRREAGDADGAARALLRALRQGVDLAIIQQELEQFSEARGSDGILALLEVRAELLSKTEGHDPAPVGEAFRNLGAARWDLAQDSIGACQAWERAANLEPESGYPKMAADLLAFAGPDDTLVELERLAAKRSTNAQAARILSVAAGVALEVGRLREALTIGARALTLDPSRTDVLAIVERSAHPEDIQALDDVYHGLAARALGIYGTRAAHYRAARQMEQRNELDRAFAHALKAFEAVPGEGVAFVMLARLVQNLGRTSELVHTLERVAQESTSKELRSHWLKQAALFADDSEAGARQRLEVLLRALLVSADLETLRTLGESMSQVLKHSPEDRDILQLRYERALGSILGRASGSQGAELLIQGLEIAFREFSGVRQAHELLASAIACDPSVPQYGNLLPYAARLGEPIEPAETLVAELLQMAGEEFSGIGARLAELAGEIALHLAQNQDAAKLFVAAAERKPDDSALVLKAERLAHQLGDKALLEQVLEAVPVKQRLAGLLEIAVQCQATGQLEEAIGVLERALAMHGLGDDDEVRIKEQLAAVYRSGGHHASLEALLQDRLDKDDLAPDARALMCVELAALIGGRGDPERALRVLSPIATERRDRGLLSDMVALAKQAGDRRAHAEALDILVDHEQDPEARLELLRELAELLRDLGDDAAALARYQEVLELDSNDNHALSALERDAERRADYEKLADILARRARVAPMVDDVRRIQLHRAMVLEQRLARPEEARAELEALLAATGDNLSVLRVLADLNERLSDPARAAALWLRASALAKDRSEAGELAFKSCEAQLRAGDVGAARRVLEGVEAWAQTARFRSLRVDVERLSEDPYALGHAIEELALASTEPPLERARLLVESAETALAVGDLKDAARRAKIAARLAPSDPEAQLMKHTLAYRTRGAGEAQDARLTVAELRGLEGQLSVEQQELRGFLLAEALDVSLAPGAGLLELETLVARIGPCPLLALGIAERALLSEDFQRAQHFFERALSGTFRNLRKEADVALQAAQTARTLGNDELALAFAETAGGDPELRGRVDRLVAELRQSLTEASEPASVGEPDLAEPTRRSSAAPPDVDATAAFDSTPKVQIAPSLASQRARAHTLKSGDSPSIEALEVELADTSAGELSTADSSERAARLLRQAELAPAPIEAAPDSSETLRLRHAGYEISGVLPALVAPAPDEADLLRRLNAGDETAARELINRLESRPERTPDLVSVCRRLVKLKPGDAWALRRLHAAASQDGNHHYARALEHVIAFFGPSEEQVAPPPLRAQQEHPEAVRAMLFRDNESPGANALRIVWEGASHVFRRDPSTYGVTGLERVPLGAPTALGKLYSEAARAMGMTRTPLFQRRSVGNVTISLALLSPPALILSGEVPRQTAALRYNMGSMLAAAWPEHVLLFGAGEGAVKSVLQALLIAFGPPSTGKSPQAVANLAEVLWESIPTSGQRQLSQLCEDPALIDYARVVAAARRVQTRSGLFVSGHFGQSLEQLMLHEQLGPGLPTTLGQLAQLCGECPSVADLVRLATSPEYAEVRWKGQK